MNKERIEHNERASDTDGDTAHSAPPATLPSAQPNPPAAEFGGRSGLDPTRYGDWEKNGRCIDF